MILPYPDEELLCLSLELDFICALGEGVIKFGSEMRLWEVDVDDAKGVLDGPVDVGSDTIVLYSISYLY